MIAGPHGRELIVGLFTRAIAGTGAVGQSWTAMSCSLSRALRLFMLLALFLGASTTHELAMAGEMNVEASITGNVQTMHFDAMEHACAAASCDLETAHCCCRMGICLAGIVVAAQVPFEDGRSTLPTAEPVPVLASSVTDDHFRPPALASSSASSTST